tara:strand:- start:1561 stop:1809 length:249 start_codon:yes stop_codon:yes gene_type:complete
MRTIKINKNEILDFLIDVQINYNEIKKVNIECKMLSNIINEMYNTILSNKSYFKNEFDKDLSNLYIAIENDNLSLFTKKYYI